MTDTKDPAAWAARAAELGAFVAAHHRMPRASIPEERRLERWLRYWRAEADRLTVEQLRTLEAIPGLQLAPREAAFETRLDEIRVFAIRTGHLPRRRSDDPDEARHARWVRDRRAEARAGTLSPDRARAARYAGVLRDVSGKRRQPPPDRS